MTEYARGDTAFHASYTSEQVRRTCPICFGQKTVRVILGDETIIQTPCDFCGLGFEGPRGYVTEWERTPRVERVTITRVSIEDGESRTICYASGHRYLSPEDLFDDEVSALTRAKELQEEADKADAKRSDSGRKHSVQTIVWSIGYHLREAKRERESAERHEARAFVLQAKQEKRAAGRPRP